MGLMRYDLLVASIYISRES